MNTKQFVRVAMLTALACVLTIVPKVPIGGGYVHFGDCIIYVAAMILGPIPGAIVGAIGHSLADFISGYPIFCIPTFIIKGIEGLVAGMIAHKYSVNKNFVNVYTILASVVAMVIMVVGYFLGGSVLEGVSASIGSVPSNAMQAVASLIIFFVLGFALYKAKIYKYFD